MYCKSFPDFSCCLFSPLSDEYSIEGSNSEILHIFDSKYTLGATEGTQGTYFCFACPPNTITFDGTVCVVEGSVLITDLREFHSSAPLHFHASRTVLYNTSEEYTHPLCVAAVIAAHCFVSIVTMIEFFCKA